MGDCHAAIRHSPIRSVYWKFWGWDNLRGACGLWYTLAHYGETNEGH